MMEKRTPLPEEYVYALDIGTRNVVGVIAAMEGDKLKLIDYHSVSHPKRSMYDGQIHEIDSVAKIVREVTDVLRERNGFHISQVSIAAAGRALITKHVTISKDLDPNVEITKNFLDVLEISAIQESQQEMEKNVQEDAQKTAVSYFCIGHSVTKYTIDEIEIKNPIDHRGNRIELEMILTFLPQSVVDSLYKVIEKTGLYVKNITLEPIAAIKVSIPDKFRLLNLALVDVGAGTSDIAITKDGHIYSYSMIDVAGDEITEAILKEYLADFDVAEALKKEISNTQLKTHHYTDILGFENTVEKSELIEKLLPLLDEMAQKIAKGILEANADSPVSAVFLIGGGCQFPQLKELLAKHLSLPQQRVAIKDISSYSDFVIGAEHVQGPENVTPFGIALHSLLNEYHDFLQIQVNDTPVRLFNSKRFKVSDALAMTGFQPRQLIAAKGEALEFSVNGTLNRVGANHGEPAKIYVNGTPAKLDTFIKNKDFINVIPATAGKPVKLKLYEYLEPDRCVYFEEKPIFLKYDIRRNGTVYEPNREDYIANGDEITFGQLRTLEELMRYLNYDGELLINEKPEDPSYPLKHMDLITKKEISETPPERESEARGEQESETCALREESEPQTGYEFQFMLNNSPLKVTHRKETMILVDIFNYIEFDTENKNGKVVIKLNGNPVRFTDEIRSGDVIEIYREQG